MVSWPAAVVFGVAAWVWSFIVAPVTFVVALATRVRDFAVRSALAVWQIVFERPTQFARAAVATVVNAIGKAAKTVWFVVCERPYQAVLRLISAVLQPFRACYPRINGAQHYNHAGEVTRARGTGANPPDPAPAAHPPLLFLVARVGAVEGERTVAIDTHRQV